MHQLLLRRVDLSLRLSLHELLSGILDDPLGEQALLGGALVAMSTTSTTSPWFTMYFSFTTVPLATRYFNFTVTLASEFISHFTFSGTILDCTRDCRCQLC